MCIYLIQIKNLQKLGACFWLSTVNLPVHMAVSENYASLTTEPVNIYNQLYTEFHQHNSHTCNPVISN